MKIGRMVKAYRKANSLTMRDFAAKSGVSHSYIAMLEDGKNSKTGLPMTPGLVTLKKLSVGMDMTLDELIATADDMPVSLQTSTSTDETGLTDKERKLMRSIQQAFRLVPEEDQQFLLAQIEATIDTVLKYKGKK
jgi:transcriptional regulator with XRE-family HTH domain